MPPLIPSSRGFVADLHSGESGLPRAGRHSLKIVAMALALAFVFVVLQSVSSDEAGDSAESVKSQPAATSTYLWKVYMLNQSARLQQQNGTSFSFDVRDLPFSFGIIQFGDYRTDATHQGIYYGGCGILVNASGNPATVSLRERAGRLISTVPYSGQDLVVFSGEWKSASYPIASTSYYGTDMLVEDWRNGTWSPDDGVFIQHPANVTATGAVFFLMVFEPEGGVLIPEFESLGFAVAIPMIAIVILGSARRAKGRKPGLTGADFRNI